MTPLKFERHSSGGIQWPRRPWTLSGKNAVALATTNRHEGGAPGGCLKPPESLTRPNASDLFSIYNYYTLRENTLRSSEG